MLTWLKRDTLTFPPLANAMREPNGLLAWGGDLSPTRFLRAYRNGIFPWFSEGDPILWWSPSQRAVFRTDRVHLPSRLRRRLRNSGWTVRADTAFADVVAGCAAPRAGQPGTWITTGMQAELDLLLGQVDQLRQPQIAGTEGRVHVLGGSHVGFVGELFVVHRRQAQAAQLTL